MLNSKKNSSRFDMIFIRRDLTFNQRAELKAKRAAAAAETSAKTYDIGPGSRSAPGALSTPSGSAEQQHVRNDPVTDPNMQQVPAGRADPDLTSPVANPPQTRSPQGSDAANQ